MDTDRYQQVSDLFQKVKDLDTDCRDLALADAEDGLIAEVQLLLAQHDRPSLRSPNDALDGMEAVDDLIGERIGDYTILAHIGSGGMGRVYRAEHGLMRRMAALKILSWVTGGQPNSPRVRRFFEREIQAIARLEHPNIVTAYDAGQSDGHFWFAMELVEGIDLSKLLKRSGPLPFSQAIECILQAARGLEYAHSQGIVHRDIKPANLLLNQNGVIKILDMGLAKLSATDDEDLSSADSSGEQNLALTHTGQMVGSVHYMSPEHAANPRNADARSDIYSMGVTLYRLLTGELPFKGDTSMEVLIAHREEKFPPLSQSLPGVPEGLDQILQNMTQRDPENRYQTMHAAIVDLEALALRCGWTMSVPESIPFNHSPAEDAFEKQRTFRIGVVAAAVLFIAAILAVVEARRWPEIPDLPPLETEEVAASGTKITSTSTASQSGAPEVVSDLYPGFTMAGTQLRYQATPGVVVQKPRILATHTKGSAIHSVAFSHDGRWIASAGGDKSIRVSDVVSGKVIHTFGGLDQPMTAVCFSSDNKAIVGGDAAGHVVVWDTENWSKFAEFSDHTAGVTSLKFLAKSPFLFSASSDGTVRMWNVIARKLIITTAKVDDRHYDIDIHPKNFTIVAGSRSGKVYRYADKNDKPPVSASGQAIRAVAFWPGTSKYLTAGSDGLIRIWESYKTEVSRVYGPRTSYGSIWSMAFRSDGKMLATGYHNKEVHLWDLMGSKPRAVLAGHAGPINSVSFSPDGKTLAVRHGNSICLWPISLTPNADDASGG